MVFDWRDYFRLASEICPDGVLLDPLCQAKIRSAISRFYYAAYMFAREHLEAEGFTIRREDNQHVVVWNQYRHSNDRWKSKIGHKGFVLKDKRVTADYCSDVTCNMDDLEESRQWASLS